MSCKFLTFLLIILVSFKVTAQVLTASGQDIICYSNDDIHRSYISTGIDQIKSTRNARLLSSDNPFEVEYFNVPGAAQNVVSYATEIWSEVISSSIPIKISVTWKELGTGTLGSARPASRKANFDGAPIRNVWYPISLAEHLTEEELNDPNEYEIIISINQERVWYFGMDGQVPEGVHDLLSVVLHEIGHGLGLSDTFDSEGGKGSWGYNGRANVYDHYIINAKEDQLIDTEIFQNNSTALNRQLTTGSLQYASRSAYLSNEEFPEIYTPFEFNSGSSISHLDEETYPAGDTNSLMSPKLSREEAIHNTGPLVNAILADMGYVWTYIDHDSVPDQPDWNMDVLVSGHISSDSALIADSAFLYYSFDEFTTQQRTPLILTNEQTEFTATIISPGIKTYVDYYFSVKANNDIVYEAPIYPYEPKFRFGLGLVTALEERELLDNILSLYPNPTNGLITLNYVPKNQSERVDVSVLNLQGNVVYDKESSVNGNSINQLIDLRTQAQGIYILQIRDQFSLVSKTILITE